MTLDPDRYECPDHHTNRTGLVQQVLEDRGIVTCPGTTGADPLHMLFEQVAGPVGAPDAAGVFCCGLRVVSVDGSTTDVPNSQENDEYFGRPSNATRDGAFPQVRWLAAAESGTGALVGATIGPYTVGEQTLARDLLPAFGAGDAGAGRPQLSVPHSGPRRAGHRGARPVAGLGVVSADPDRGCWPMAATWPCCTRAARPTGRRSRCGSSSTPCTPPHRTVTRTPRNCSAWSPTCSTPRPTRRLDLACAYPMRWECETVIGHHKTDMGQGMAVLRSKDPEGVAQEMWALFAVYQAIHTLIGAAVDATGIPPGPDQLPARPGRRDRLRHGGLSPLMNLTWPWPPSCSRSSTRDSSSATGPTGPAHGPPRRPATSPPAKINPASPKSPAQSSSTCSAPGSSPESNAIGT